MDSAEDVGAATRRGPRRIRVTTDGLSTTRRWPFEAMAVLLVFGVLLVF